ncbi:Tup1 like transcriptional repressor [Natrarchaeobaculum sulfurireducens]|uniref:Tup1 like transcriptional repressor n=1 Tax=Natrarchaeobaculum sulfurireducens TaxID=2044521 RepID=A0A346PQ34_9EURY|nr:PQQ-binding-like beta-propeller repeat protein [Natrarchaeobaculum sulfurireducens]AXR78342.1 WD40/PQQ-like beta propeller repeat containing protein [Natrarchaeobaculum sulfurireducens]AXR81629.1 Tup1 like transcriptional repressor [Natrarchaeobaculum sulfurireducens]
MNESPSIDAGSDAVLSAEAELALGDLGPAASRHNWRRSAVAVGDETVFAGLADGRVIAARLAEGKPEQRWSVDGDGERYVVSMDVSGDRLVIGERGSEGRICVRDAETGALLWEYVTAEDVGSPTNETFFAQPFVVDVRVAGDQIVAAARRYERDGDVQEWSSVVYGFDLEGDLEWAFDVQASPIAFDVDDEQVAVAYNRCPDTHDHECGLVVLDLETGDEVANWDPGTPGERRVGDVALTDDGIVVASHGDKHGYLLENNCGERWRVDLASERDFEGETLYAYPNHVAVVDGTAVFVTGNTFAEKTRDPDGRHPNEHTAFGVDLESGEAVWSHDVRGFARCVSAAGDLVAVPSAQNFRERDAETHAVHLFEAGSGLLETHPIKGISSAGDLADDRLAVIEEPVEYHDEGITRGEYRLHTWRLEAADRDSSGNDSLE